MPDPHSDMCQIRYMTSALPLASARLGKVRILVLCLNDLIDGDLCKISFISKFSLFFLVFKYDFIRSIDFTNVSASNTASDDVTN